SGVSLSLNVDGLEERDGRAGPEALFRLRSPENPASLGETRRPASAKATAVGPQVTGGIIVTVVGSLASDRLDEWRAGRLVLVPVQLRRPSRYLDPGVPEQERALAPRGTRLGGPVKRGALGDLLERGRVRDEAEG